MKVEEAPIETPIGFESMIVVDYHELDACGFLLLRKDSTYLEPVQMDPAFFQHQLKVFVKYQLAKNQLSGCMRGKRIDILEIKQQGR